MRVYIATKFENTNQFNELKALIEAKGHWINHDWTNGTPIKSIPAEKLGDFLKDSACNDFMGVKKCHALIFIPVQEPMAGAWVEMGIALAEWKRVIVIDNGLKNCIFFNLPGVLKARDFNHAVELLDL